MLGIEKVDHIGIRVSSKETSIAFYEDLGFKTLMDAGFEDGHPVILQHPCGVVINLLGPSTAADGGNILMDVDEKHPGITHVSFKVASMEETKAFLASKGIALTGGFSFKGMEAVFIRDPDRNVIELDAYAGAEPLTRADDGGTAAEAFRQHPG
ncbi:VOC family protein [Pelagibius sp.]|uniref:VOC family protein n=1 Tax=Pelagibius sp. TaxID=1931238 RepID=UPI0026323521|nr:VOC family protein [Pelagibius sp.]